MSILVTMASMPGGEMQMRACHRLNSDKCVFGAKTWIIEAIWRCFFRLFTINTECYFGPTPIFLPNPIFHPHYPPRYPPHPFHCIEKACTLNAY